MYCWGIEGGHMRSQLYASRSVLAYHSMAEGVLVSRAQVPTTVHAAGAANGAAASAAAADGLAAPAEADGYRLARGLQAPAAALRAELAALLSAARWWDKPCDWLQVQPLRAPEGSGVRPGSSAAPGVQSWQRCSAPRAGWTNPATGCSFWHRGAVALPVQAFVTSCPNLQVQGLGWWAVRHRAPPGQSGCMRSGSLRLCAP